MPWVGFAGSMNYWQDYEGRVIGEVCLKAPWTVCHNLTITRERGQDDVRNQLPSIK
jgi:hypothetical protein